MPNVRYGTVPYGKQYCGTLVSLGRLTNRIVYRYIPTRTRQINASLHISVILLVTHTPWDDQHHNNPLYSHISSP